MNLERLGIPTVTFVTEPFESAAHTHADIHGMPSLPMIIVPQDYLEELSDEEFEALRDSWPMGRLARLVGLSREELLRLPYAPGRLLSLEGPEVDLASLLGPAAPAPG